MASLIERRGVGNGYAVVVVASWILEVVHAHPIARLTAAQLALAVATITVATVAITAMLRWRVRAPTGASIPLPPSGIEPVAWAVIAVAVGAVIGGVGLDAVMRQLHDGTARLEHLGITAVVVSAVVWSWLNARPRLRAAQLTRAGAAAAAVGRWGRATLLGTALLVAVFEVVSVGNGLAALPSIVTMVVFAVATLLDISDELRARSRGELVAVGLLASPLLGDAVRDALAAQGITCHLRGTHMAAALWFFGPFARVAVLAPVADAPRAAQVVSAIVG